MKIKKYKIQLILIVIIAILAVVKVKYGYHNQEQGSDGGEPESEQEEKILDPEYPLWDRLPYSGTGYIIDRYIEPLTIAVKIKGIDQEIIEKEVWEWMESEGVATESHKLVWE